jgi:hypothetical protein
VRESERARARKAAAGRIPPCSACGCLSGAVCAAGVGCAVLCVRACCAVSAVSAVLCRSCPSLSPAARHVPSAARLVPSLPSLDPRDSDSIIASQGPNTTISQTTTSPHPHPRAGTAPASFPLPPSAIPHCDPTPANSLSSWSARILDLTSPTPSEGPPSSSPTLCRNKAHRHRSAIASHTVSAAAAYE